MKKNIKRISIAFNLDDPDQEKMYQHAKKRTNRSAYCKRLIQRDMDGCTFVVASSSTSETEPEIRQEWLVNMVG